MNSTTKAAIISFGLIIAVVGVAFFFLSDDGGVKQHLGRDDTNADPVPLKPGIGAESGEPQPERRFVPDPDAIEVRVSIVDKVNGRDLSRASLRAFVKQDSEKMGDIVFDSRDPRFSKRGTRSAQHTLSLKPGRYTLAARCPGYATASVEITVVDGSDPISRVLELERGTSISGTILAEDGSPIAGAKVAAFRDLGGPDEDLESLLIAMIGLEEMQREASDTEPVLSDPTGRYQIDGLTAGTFYTVRAAADGLSPQSKKQVRAPKSGVDFKLNQGATLEGVVRNSEGNPIEGAKIEAFIDPGNAGLFEIILLQARPAIDDDISRSDGRYSLSQLGAGLYNFKISAPQYQMRTIKGIRIEENVSNSRDFSLEAGFAIHGIVRGPDGQPLAGAKVRVNALGRTASSGRDDVNISLKEDPETDAEGLFRFDTLPDGKFMLIVFHNDYQSFQRRDIRPSDTEIVVDLEEGGQLHGQILDRNSGEPVAGAMVSVAAVSNFRRKYTSNQQGDYVISGLGGGSRRKASVQIKAEGYARAKESIRVSNGVIERNFELVGNGQVSGRVVYGSDGVPGARVEVRRIQESTGTAQIVGHAMTDNQGAYIIDEVEPGSGLVLRIKKQIYLDELSAEFDLETGDTIEMKDISLRLGGAISGLVSNLGGAPIVGCMVSVYYPNETRRVNQGNDDYTKADGTYSLQGLPAGQVDLVFTANGFVEHLLKDVQIKEGQRNTNQDARLEVAGRIGGKIVDSSGKPIAGADLKILDFADGLSELQGVSKADGTFLFNNVVSKGSVKLEVQHSEYTSVDVGDVEVGSLEIEVVLEELGSIIGTVVGPDGDPITNFTVQARPLGTSSEARKAKSKLRSRNFNDGRFDYRGVPDGEYDLNVRSPVFSVQTIKVTVSNGEAVDVGEIVLSEGGLVSGRVISAASGEPVHGAKIRVVQGPSRFKDRSQATSKTTNQNGEFSISGLKAGALTLEVTHANFGSKRVTGVDTQLAGKSTDLVIELEKGGSLRGVVETSAGKKMAGMWVYLKTGSSRQDRRTQTDASGSFNFTSVPAGLVTLTAHKFVTGERPLKAEKQIDVRAGDVLDNLVLIVEPGR